MFWSDEEGMMKKEFQIEKSEIKEGNIIVNQFRTITDAEADRFSEFEQDDDEEPDTNPFHGYEKKMPKLVPLESIIKKMVSSGTTLTTNFCYQGCSTRNH